MPQKSHHAPGNFCWWDVATTAADAGKSFYGAPVAGCMAITPEMGPLPTHWMPYVAVNDADQTAKRVGELGGKVVHGPEDVPGVGRFLVLQDPQGAVLSAIRLNPKP